jgi:hypothetical protein
VGDTIIDSINGVGLSADVLEVQRTTMDNQLTEQLTNQGYPLKADPAAINKPMVVSLMVILVIYLTMVYSPAAAWLVELFPPQIRYTATSLPYNIGNGWFGGFMPATAFAMVASTGDIYYGLWYPVVVAGCTFVIGLFCLPETRFDQDHTAVEAKPIRATAAK